MKTILCYGDSMTWGYIPPEGSRLSFEQRWPGILQTGLGNNFRVVEEALNGRTTNWDSPFLFERNGAKTLNVVLESQSPVDIVILMLGTNDLWKGFDFSASDIGASCMSLIWKVQQSQCGPGAGIPDILLIAPPVLGKLSEKMKFFFEGRQSVSRKLGAEYKKVAEITGCHFLDASKYIKPGTKDGVHPDAAGHKKLAAAVKKSVESITGKSG